MAELLLDTFESAIGKLFLVTNGKALCALDFEGYEPRMMKLLEKRYGAVCLIDQPHNLSQELKERLQAYFSGNFDSLDQVPVNIGGTPFQQQVWLGLRSIPPGTTLTYRELAAKLGKPAACRAVGMTNSLNPVSIVLPCHRVIGASGKLTGYAGGLERKRWLLQHEGVELLPHPPSFSQMNLLTV